jgi:iron complex outermembrane receptor protein
VRIGVLTVGMLASVNLPKVEAAQPTTTAADSTSIATDEELSEVTVSGTMSPLTALQSARIVGLITSQQIESSAAQTVNDLLKTAVGVDVRQRGGFGIQTDISINGGTFDQIIILLNGVNITSPQTGHLAADFPVSLSDIERIEILEGAASRVYGASAFGGAINIVTKKKSTPTLQDSSTYLQDPPPALPRREGAVTNESRHHLSVEGGMQGGSYATFGADARVSSCLIPRTGKAGEQSVFWSASGGILRSSGATVNSDFVRGNAFFSGSYDADDFRIDAQAGYSQKSYGANTFYSAAYPNQYERNRRFITSLGAETKGRVRLRPEVYWNRLVDNFQLIRGTSTGENFHRTDVYGARVTADIRWVAGRTAVGGEVREEGIYSSSLGMPLPVPINGAFGGTYNYHDARTNLSFNIEHTLLLPHFTASVGVLANKNSRFDDAFRFYPGVDLAYTPNSHWRLFASWDKGFRLPTFTDLYYKSPTHEGNQGMRAEESQSFQVGAKMNYNFSFFIFQFSINSFYHRGNNMIDWVMYSPDDVFHSANFDLDNMGVSVQANFQFSIFNFQLSYAFIHQQRHDDTYVYKSNYAMEYLRHKVVCTLDHKIISRLSASWTLRWQDRMGSYLLYEDAQSTGRLVPYDPYATLDLKLRWVDRHYELWAEGTNLLNRHYYDLGNVPQPGIMVLGGVRVRF